MHRAPRRAMGDTELGGNVWVGRHARDRSRRDPRRLVVDHLIAGRSADPDTPARQRPSRVDET